MELAVTQFVRPNGRRRPVTATVPDALEPKVRAMLAEGFRFTAEVLPNGTVALAIEDNEQDLAMEFARNVLPGEEDNLAPNKVLARMIEKFKLEGQ